MREKFMYLISFLYLYFDSILIVYMYFLNNILEISWKYYYN